MAEQGVEVVKGMYEAFGRGDVPAVLGAMAADIEWHEAEGMPYGGVYHGPDEVAQKVFGPQIEDIPDFAPTPEEFIATGDTVAAVVRYTGTGKSTGKALNLQVVHVWDVRDGQIARFRQFADTVKYREVVSVEAAAST
jgi:ketosteroid isomerase-like protein